MKTDKERAEELKKALIVPIHDIMKKQFVARSEGDVLNEKLIDLIEAAFAEIRKESGWLPIESAPEHTVVWVNVMDHGLSCCPDGMCLAVLDGGLWHGCGSYSNMLLSGTPTHWMPLPAAPKGE